MVLGETRLFPPGRTLVLIVIVLAQVFMDEPRVYRFLLRAGNKKNTRLTIEIIHSSVSSPSAARRHFLRI